jgi:hypothetical protein
VWGYNKQKPENWNMTTVRPPPTRLNTSFSDIDTAEQYNCHKVCTEVRVQAYHTSKGKTLDFLNGLPFHIPFRSNVPQKDIFKTLSFTLKAAYKQHKGQGGVRLYLTPIIDALRTIDKNKIHTTTTENSKCTQRKNIFTQNTLIDCEEQQQTIRIGHDNTLIMTSYVCEQPIPRSEGLKAHSKLLDSVCYRISYSEIGSSGKTETTVDIQTRQLKKGCFQVQELPTTAPSADRSLLSNPRYYVMPQGFQIYDKNAVAKILGKRTDEENLNQKNNCWMLFNGLHAFTAKDPVDLQIFFLSPWLLHLKSEKMSLLISLGSGVAHCNKTLYDWSWTLNLQG